MISFKQIFNEDKQALQMERNRKFLRERDPADIQRIINTVTKSLKIPFLDIVNVPKMSNLGDISGGGALTKGRHVAFVKNERDTITAIHELIHHVQTFLTKGGDSHGSSWNTASNKVTKLLNKKFKLALIKQNF